MNRHHAQSIISRGIRVMVQEAKKHNHDICVFDVRYATQGLPEVTKDYLYFSVPGSYEVLESGNLETGKGRKVQCLAFPKLVPIASILTVEECFRIQEP